MWIIGITGGVGAGKSSVLDYIEEKEQRGELFVIRPDAKLPVSRVEKDPEKLKAAYSIGRKTAEAQLQSIRAFLTDPC